MPSEYLVSIKVTAGWLLRVKAESPEAAASMVEKLSVRDQKRGDFFVNQDYKISEVYDLANDVTYCREKHGQDSGDEREVGEVAPHAVPRFE